MITGKIKQIETMGLVDGPGVRVVIFMQGCTLRCIFCHNPEMWSLEGGITITPDEVLNTVLKYKNYFGEEGGVTFSGGEPLAQPKFLIECLKLCKEHNIHTCIDTAGVGNNSYFEEVLKYTDLVLFSIKGLTEEEYQKISKGSMNKSLEFLNLCRSLNKKMWIRSVIVPGINDTEEYIESLAEFIKPLSNILKVELLSYHTMGVSKYKELGIDYSLIDTKPMGIDKTKKFQEKLNKLLNI
jgi:pyruvate formate lyase activating enzyme